MFFVLIKGFVSLICYFNHCCKYILYFIVHKVHILKKKGEFLSGSCYNGAKGGNEDVRI